MKSHRLFDDLQRYADEIVTVCGPPALSLAVWHNNRVWRAASGILNVESGVEATVDSVFQIGSISKAFTAALIMLLVDEGKVNLDNPVRFYLKDFHVADHDATNCITVRHLLGHSSGLISDVSFYQDAYEDGNAISRYVDRCFLLPQVHKKFGERFSYSNAAYVIAGRLIEVVSGTPWHQAIDDRIFKPLQMAQSVAIVRNILRFRAAMGHLFVNNNGDRQKAVPAATCYLPAGMAPTGAILTMSASDLLKFARVHLRAGKTESGHQWMSESSIKAMQELHVELPAPCTLFEAGWGLGWAITDCGGVRVWGHGGGTIGQQALLEFIPEHDFAMSVQVNGMDLGGAPAIRRVFEDMLDEVIGVRPERAVPIHQTCDLARFVGQFGMTGWTFEIKEVEGQLHAQMKQDGSAALPPQTFYLKPLGGDRFSAYSLDGTAMDDFAFIELDVKRRPQYLFAAYRLHRRVETEN